MKSISDTQPHPINDVEIKVEKSLIINFNHTTEEVTIEDNEPHTQYVSECVYVRGNRGYGDIVSAIVKDRYSDDDSSAIMANHAACLDVPSTLTDEKIAEYTAEYNKFQEWRARAKEVAKEVISRL